MLFLTLSFLLYFAPALLATSRRNPKATAIWLTNFFVGWTIIGWVIRQIWALNTAPLPYAGAGAYAPVYPGVPPMYPGAPSVSPADPLSSPVTSPSYSSADAGAGSVPGWSAVGDEIPAAGGALRTCVACGRAVPSDARFCPACGSLESPLG